MNLLQTAVIFILFIATIITIGLAFFAWQRRPAVWVRPFSLLMLTVSAWTLAQALEINTPFQADKIFWTNVRYVGITLVPVTFLGFSLAYHSQRTWITKQYLPLFIIPAATLFFAWTGIGDLFWQDIQVGDGLIPYLEFTRGPWFWVNVAYSYILVLFGTLLLLQVWLRAAHRHRQQAAIIVLGAVLPWVGNVLYLIGLTAVDLTPIGFTLTGILLGWGLFRLHLFDLAPMARRVVLDHMRDGVIVLDRQQRVADINVAAEKIVGRPVNDVLGQHIRQIMPQLDWLTDDTIAREDEITLAGQTYELQVSPLYSNQTVNGRLLLFHNITPRKKAEAELTQQSAFLKNLVIIARATTTTHTVKATLQNILDVSVSMSQAESGSLFVINAKGEITHSILAQDEALPVREQQAINQQVLEKGLFGWVLRSGKLALVCNTAKDERWLSIPERRSQKAGSALAVPIADSRGVIGVLTLTHSQVNYFHEEQASLMQGAADQMALALRNAQLYDQQAYLAEREHILYEVIRATGESLDAKMITRTAVDAISHFTAWPALAILLGREGFLVVDAATGALAGTEGTLTPIGNDVIGRAFKQNKVETAVSFNDNGLFASFHSGIAVPLRHSDKVIGILTAQSETTDRFGKEDAQLAESLAEAVALALENAWLHNNIRKNAADLNTLLESSRDGIIYLGLDKNVRVINEPAVTMLGLTKPTTHWTTRPLNSIFEAVQTHLAASQEPNMDSLTSLLALQDEISLIRTGTEPVTEGDLLLPPHMLRWLNLPVKTDNEALGRLLVLRDVTEEWQLERMRDDLIHMTVHDLRNPLSAQIMALEVLAHDLPAAQRPIYDVLDANSRRMLNLVNNILDINRLENRKMPLNYTYVTASNLIDMAMKQQKSLARQKHIKLEKEVTDELPFAWIDEALIERVLQNLIGNAVKFTPNEGTIRVSVQPDAESYGEMLCVSVFNTGEGIPPDLRDRMFQKFSTGKQEGRGSGLGLAFCKMVVEAHNGRIWLDSIPGQSATFHFTIPAA